jgi:uncharacterized protein (TIGR02118 family)
MIKVLAPAQRHPTNRALAEFHHYWGESHGPLFANSKSLRRYVQHLTLPEAYGLDPSPTFDGISMFWYEDVQSRRVSTDDPEILALLEGSRGVSVRPEIRQASSATDPVALALLRAVLKDDAQLFDRSPGWPRHLRAGAIMAEERVIVDGPAAPEMVKAILITSKLPGLTLDQFFNRWHDHHGPLTSKLPGLRRYTQNHAIPDAYADRGQTHDGWSELWFDDLEALRRATETREWQTIQQDTATLFAQPMGIGIARERTQKDLDWTYHDWNATTMTEPEIREQLTSQGYTELLATHPDAPQHIMTAAATQTLAVWTKEHLVTTNHTQIDTRPG